MADIQSNDVPLLLSDDNWTTTYTIVCQTSGGFKLSSPITTEDSYCGVHTGIGNAAFSIQFGAVVKSDPTTPTGTPLVGEASYKKLLSWANAQTLLKFKVASGTLGVNFHHEGSCYLNDLSLDMASKQVIKCSGTLTGTGVLDIVP